MLNVHCSSSQDASDKVGKIMMIQVWIFIDYPGMAKKHDFGSFYAGWASTSYNCGYNPLKWPFE